MKKIYKATTVKMSSSFRTGLVKNISLLVIGLMGACGYMQAQVTVLPATPYTTLKAAFDAINNGVHTGAITINITSNTSETSAAILNSSGTGSASYTNISIVPTANATISGAFAPAIIKLNGADNVTIDGLNAGAQLTITNTFASTGAAIIWLGSASSSDGCTNNVIRNCIIRGNSPTTTFIGIVSSSGTTIGGVAEAANTGNIFQLNTISTSLYGIALVGPTGNESNNIISNNSIGSAVAGNKHSLASIFIAQQANISIAQNTIFGNISATTTPANTGIFVGGTIVGGSIDKNRISDIKKSSVWGCSGIQLNSTSLATNLTISNNFIWDIASGGFNGTALDDNGYGIAVNTGGGYNIYYNSVNLNTNQTSAVGTTAALWISPSVTGSSTLNIRNNIFSNSQTTSTRYSVFSARPNTVFANINYNDYYSTGSVGFLGGAQATLPNWQTATGQDANSVAANPSFFTPINLHLFFNSPLDGLATPIAGITRDIDGDSRNATTPDMGADEFTPPTCSANTGGTATPAASPICASSSTTVSATGYAFGIGISYQWQYFNGTIWVDMPGETNPFSALVTGLTATTQFRLKVTCANCCGGAPNYSTTATVVVNNPQVSGTTPGTRCGTGTVNLAATSAIGTINWYAAPTGGSPLFTGSPFTTPVVSTTTNFYVAASLVGSPVSGGKTSTAGADGGFNGTDAGLVFDAFTAMRILSVKMYPQGATSVVIEARTSAGVLIPGCSFPYNFTSATSTGELVPINFTIPAGTAHRLIVSSNTASVPIWRDFTGHTFPYALGTFGTIQTGYITGNIGTYYFFYDWQVADVCEGSRVAVAANVTVPPVFTSVSPAAGTPRTICSGSSVNLNVTSANGGYVYTWNPGALAGAAQNVTPAFTTTYTVTANDGICRRDSAVIITVNPTPTDLTVVPVTAGVCSGSIVQITATGGKLLNQTVFSETFESFPLTQMAVTGTGVVANQNTTYFSQGTQSVLLTHSNSIDGQLAMTNSINLSLYTNPKLTFDQICALEPTFDFGYIQYSNDGGATWFDFDPTDYISSGTIYNGVVSFDKTSYSDWNTTFATPVATPGTGPATSLWKSEALNLQNYQGFTNFRIRFRLDADVSVLYFGWLIDNVRISGDGQAPITWTPCGVGSELYSDAPATTLYNCGDPATNVFSKPTVNHVYTATAFGGIGCTKIGTSTINVSASSSPSVTIAAIGGTTICQGQSITFNATPVNGGPGPSYKWFVNNVQVNLPLGFNPGQNPYTINGLNNGDVVTCQLLSNSATCATPNPSPQSPGITITVNPKPTVSIDGPLTRCFPSTLTLTTTGTISTYEWFLNGGAVGGNTPTYPATGPGTYSVIVTSNQGCKDTAADKILVEQTYTITATATNGTISPPGVSVVNCGANQVFTYTPNPGPYGVCDVLIDGVSIGIVASPYTFTNVTANHTIHVEFCITGCGTVYIANAGIDDSTCANVNFPLAGSLTSAPVVGGLTATWSSTGGGTFNPNNVFGTATSYTPSAADIIAGSVKLSLLTSNPTGAPCVAATDTMILHIKPIPAITVSGLLGICTAGAISTSVTASATIAAGTISGYQWFNPALIGSLATQVITATGNYSVTASASNGCANSLPVTIIAFTNPSAPVITPGTATICVGTSTSLTANVASPGNAGASINPVNGYQWYNPASIGGATAQNYSPSAPATYTVTATNSNGCLSTASAGAVVSYDNTPLNGVYTIGVGPASCTNYTSFANAIADLNTRTISGNVRFDIPAGYTETAPSLGLKLGSASLNASIGAFAITFRKNGVGANPVINAYPAGSATPASLVPDGIWSLRGVDNVVIDGIDLFDGNTTGNSLMDYGFGLFKLSSTDGAQNNLIQNCTITLKRTNDVLGTAIITDGATGILLASCQANVATTAIVPTSAAGTNSNNKFYSNIIQNCNTGIGMIGYAAPSPFTLGDTNNDIGGVTAGTGNSILNFGGAAFSTTTAVAVRALHAWGLNVSNNTIDNNNGAGANHVSILRGIQLQAGASASVTVSGNNISLKSSALGGQQIAAIDNAIGSTPAGNTILISNNTITGTYATAAGAATMTGIFSNANAATINIIGNTVQNYSLPAGTGGWTGINNNAAVSVTNINISNNTVQNCTIASTGTMTAIGNTISGATNLNMSTNTINNISKTVLTGVTSLLQTFGATNAIVNDNVFTNNVVTATGATGPVTMNCIVGSTAIYTIDNNYMFNNSITGIPGAFVATLSGYSNVVSPTQETITNNTIRKLFVTGTSTGLHIVQGINSTVLAGLAVKNISNNTVANLYTAFGLSATVYGIRTSNGATVNVFRNKVDSLFPGQSATAGSYAAGIRVNSGTVVNVHNNFINLDLTTATAPAANAVLTGSDALRGIEHNNTATAINIYYNTIRLAGAGAGAVFGTSGVSINNATPPTGDLRNNIIVNLTTPGGTAPGFAVAYRRAIPVNPQYVSTSNNNLFYAGTPGPSRLLYFDGTTGYQTMLAYQSGAGISPRESNSVTLMPNFVSLTDLHLQAAISCSVDGQAQVIGGYTSDYDTDVRDALTPDMGADEFTGTGGAPGVWKGVVNTDWNNINNWCDAVPGAGTNVTIPTGLTNYPVIITGTPIAKNVNIAAGGSITITGVGKLGIYGGITNAGTFNVVDGTIEMLGTSPQTIPANAFQNNDIKNLIIGNASVTLGGDLKLYGKLSFNGSNRAFATAGFLTLRSTATGTASVGDITAGGATGNTITGDVTVERFVSARRSWRFLSVPTQNNLQTIHEAWQENQAPNANTVGVYGIHISKDSANWNTTGFDVRTIPGPSMKYYVPATNSWKGITSTINVPGVDNGRFVTGRGYMTLVRGDRTVNTIAPATTTILRDKGLLVTGNFGPVAVPGAPQFAAIGNPYASAVNFGSLTKVGLEDRYYMWDPQLGTLGAYQTFDWNSGFSIYEPTPGGGSYAGGNYYIESGQAFFVKASGAGGGSLTFTEPSKRDGSNLVVRPAFTDKRLRTNLYLVDASTGTSNLYDGVLSQFDGSYSVGIDQLDAIKLTNSGENLGIQAGDKKLSVERRPELSDNDTIYYNLSQLRVQHYEFEFTAENIAQPGLSGYLEDKYLATKTPVNMDGVTRVAFDVINDAGSYAADRFRLVFKLAAPVPTSFASIRANKQDRNILVEWKVENELNIHHYEVERSSNGVNFTKMSEQAARGNGSGIDQEYSWLDISPLMGDNFYRIRSVGISNGGKLSQQVKVNMSEEPSLITVFPNPVREDGLLYVNMANQPAGEYRLNLMNNEGQVMMKRTLNHAGGSSVYSVILEKFVAHGNYLLNVAGNDNVNLTFKIVY